MFNLIRRDIILQKRQLILFIPFILFFIIMETNPILIFIIASLIIPFNAYVYDEKAETNILLNSLPYTRTEIIASRYLGAIVYMVLAIGVTSLTLIVFNKPFTMNDIAISCSLFLLFAAFTFPLFYIFNPSYVFPVIIIGFLLLAGIGPKILLFLSDHLTAATEFVFHLSIPVLYTGATLGIVVVYVISWGITNIIYQRKAF